MRAGLLGRRQVVRHRFLVPAFAGSNPAAPASVYEDCARSFRNPFRNLFRHPLARPVIDSAELGVLLDTQSLDFFDATTLGSGQVIAPGHAAHLADVLSVRGGYFVAAAQVRTPVIELFHGADPNGVRIELMRPVAPMP